MDVSVPPHDPRVGFLLPPVVMEPASEWLPLNMDQRKDDRGPSPFHVAGKPFLPRATFQINGVNREKLVLIAWEPGRAQDPASGIEIQSSLMDAKGQAVPAGMIRIDKVNREEGGRRTYVLDYTPDKLASGDYTLRIGVGEVGGGAARELCAPALPGRRADPRAVPDLGQAEHHDVRVSDEFLRPRPCRVEPHSFGFRPRRSSPLHQLMDELEVEEFSR